MAWSWKKPRLRSPSSSRNRSKPRIHASRSPRSRCAAACVAKPASEKRQPVELAAEPLELGADADPLVDAAGMAEQVPGAQQHGAEHLGIVEIAGDRLGLGGPVRAPRRRRRTASATARSTSSRARAAAALVAERGEGGLGDRPAFRHRVDEPDGAELRDRRGGTHEGVGVALLAAPAAAASSSIGRPRGSPRWCERGADADRQVEHRAGIRWIEGARRIEGAPVVGDGLVVGVGMLVAPAPACRESATATLGVADRHGQAGVAGPLGEQPLVVGPGGQRGGGPGVQLEPAAQRQRPVAVRAEQGVDEARTPAPPGRVRLDEAGRLGRLQRLEHGEQRRAVGGRQQVGVELGTERRRLVEHGAGLVVEELVALVEPDRQACRGGRRR